MTDRKRVLSFLKELIATNSESPPGREEEVAKVIRSHLEAYGVACQSVGPSDRPNLVFSSHEGEKGSLVLHGHMDTVPIGTRENWTHDPFGSEIIEGRLYGRGACDMKGPIASLAETLIIYTEERHERPLLLLTTSDEESGFTGAEEVAKSGILEGMEFGVCAEPTGLDVLIGERGTFWFKVVARGKSAHGSRPEEGVNAISLCMQALTALTQEEYPYEDDELMGKYTLNVGLIKGGVKINVVPDHCEAHLDMRFVRGQTIEVLSEKIRSRLVEAGLSDRVSIEHIHEKPLVVTPSDAEIVKVSLDAVEKVVGRRPILKVATYGTDCSVLQTKIGITNVICGPGYIEQAHQPDEYIPLDQLYRSIDVYLAISRFFGRKQE
jgi:succinyl-diaminopimelate desuccinylase